MKDNFQDRVKEKLQASGETGRMDLEMHDAKVIEAGTAVRVLATYSDLFGPPSVLDIQNWLKTKLADFGDRVSARMDTIQALPELNAVSFIVDQRLLRQPLASTATMTKAGPDTFIDNDSQLWEVVSADPGPGYIVRKEGTSVEEMLAVREEALRGALSARQQVTLASLDTIPSAGGGFANVDLGDTVDFYFEGQIQRGTVQSAGASGVKISGPGGSYTVDAAAITSIVEKSAGSAKESDDIQRRYFSRVYPGNPAMTEAISPLSNLPLTDNRPPPGGEPIQPIEVAASTRVSGSIAGASLVVAAKAPFGYLQDYKTGEDLRPATKKEADESKKAAKSDGGSGVIEVDGKSVFVSGSARPFGKTSK